MKKFLPFSRRQPSLDRHSVNRVGWPRSDRFNVKSMRRTSATSLNTKSIQVVRGAYNIDLNKVDSSFTKLHRACLLNDENLARKQIYKVDNNSHDSSSRYPIHLATVNGNFAIVKLLIENGANPNVKDNEDNTPLIKSIECGHEHLVKYLLSNNADPNITDSENNTALHWAIMTESIIAIEALMSSKKCDISLRNNKDESCLHLAVRSPLINNQTFESMIIAGSEIRAKDQLGLTALDIAQACDNQTAIVVFHRFLKSSKVDSTKEAKTQCDNQEDRANIKKMCEDYRQKYLMKNRENLESEKRLIQLSAQIERLKLDMSYVKEDNEKLTSEFNKMTAENKKLKSSNINLTAQIERLKKEKEAPFGSARRAEIDEARRSEHVDNGKIQFSECKNHKEFLANKAFLQEKINKLKIVKVPS